MTFKVDDKIAAAVLTYKRADLRVGVIEKIHPPTYSITETRYTIRDANGRAHVVSHARSVRIEADEYHTMAELYEYRMLYNAHAAHGWLAAGVPVVKSWHHSDGEQCFGGGWFVVVATLPTGQVSNHYPGDDWHLFRVPEVDLAPEWDGHTPAQAAQRLRNAL